MSRKTTQQRLGREKVFETTQKLMSALERMHTGRVINLTVPFELTKQNLAIEAGVNEATLYRKKDGKYMYADVLAVFDAGKPFSSKNSRDYLIRENAALREQVRKCQKIIADLTEQRLRAS